MSTCTANHCALTIQPGRLMCIRHWSMLPRDIQRAVWEAHHDHSSRGARLASFEYLSACADAVEFIARSEGRLTRNAFRNLARMVEQRLLTNAASEGGE
jgi:hypothetical protein